MGQRDGMTQLDVNKLMSFYQCGSPNPSPPTMSPTAQPPTAQPPTAQPPTAPTTPPMSPTTPPPPPTTPPPPPPPTLPTFPPASSCSGSNIEEEGEFFEGDMILPSDVAKNHINNAVYRWPGGTVPYVIEGTFSEYFIDNV